MSLWCGHNMLTEITKLNQVWLLHPIPTHLRKGRLSNKSSKITPSKHKSMICSKKYYPIFYICLWPQWRKWYQENTCLMNAVPAIILKWNWPPLSGWTRNVPSVTFKLWSSKQRCHIVWNTGTSASQQPAASIFMVKKHSQAAGFFQTFVPL